MLYKDYTQDISQLNLPVKLSNSNEFFDDQANPTSVSTFHCSRNVSSAKLLWVDQKDENHMAMTLYYRLGVRPLPSQFQVVFAYSIEQCKGE